MSILHMCGTNVSLLLQQQDMEIILGLTWHMF